MLYSSKSFKCIRQHDSMECGIACLSMICRHYGKTVPLHKLRELCPPTPQGVSMLALEESAKTLGFDTACAKVKLQDLKSSHLPCVLYWKQSHFVVLYAVDGNEKFSIADPNMGKRICSVEEMEECWCGIRQSDTPKGVALLMTPSADFRLDVADKGMKLNSWLRLLKYGKNERGHLILAFCCLVSVALIQLVLPYLMQSVVDVGINTKDISFIWLVLLGQFVLLFSRTAMDLWRRWILLRINLRLNVDFISGYFEKLFRLPMSYFESRLKGDFLQRISDHGRVNSFFTGESLNAVYSLFSLVAFSVVLFIYSPVILGVLWAGSMLFAWWILLFLKERKWIDYRLFEENSRSESKTFEMISSMEEIKLQGCEEHRLQEWKRQQRSINMLHEKSQKLQQRQEAGSILISAMRDVVITAISAEAVIHGKMTLGMMLAVQYIVGQLTAPIEQLLRMINSMQDVRLSLERIADVHTEKEEDTKNCHAPSVCGRESFCNGAAIDLEHVSFKYDRYALRDTIHDVSLQIPWNKQTAIVGASGSGKTTLLKLILGYYPPLSGKIRINGEDLSGLSKREWRMQCGVVMQDGMLFSDSIKRNIAVNDEDVDLDKLDASAELARIKNYVMKLPQQYDTRIGENGVGLSLGQKQRLLLARALYRNPSFLFLDEATNSLDASNERSIVEGLRGFGEGRTVVVIAHRLSTVKESDQIVVMDAGSIVEIGTHDELLKRRGHYYNLVKDQLELDD